MKFIKHIIVVLFFMFSSYFSFATAPSINSINGNDIGYKIEEVNGEKSLLDNLKGLFFPNSYGTGGIIWEKLRVIFVGLLLIFFVWAGAMFILKAGDEGELKKAKSNLIYIFYGAFLLFAATWILGTILNIGGETTAETVLDKTKSSILLNILIFFKSLAYWVAIIMMIYYGYKIMQAQEKEDKIKAGRNGVLNIIIALVAIKVLDYLYYIAQQSDFRSEAGDFLTSTGKVLGWILGVLLVLVILYAGILLVSSRGNEEAMKKSKTIIRNVFLVVFVLFLFIVIVYDMVKNINL